MKKQEIKKQESGSSVPRVILINGKVQVVKGSTEIDVGKNDPKNLRTNGLDSGNRRGKKQKQRSEKWSEEETKKFYQALRIFGTDFSMIEKLLPNRSRKQIKVSVSV